MTDEFNQLQNDIRLKKVSLENAKRILENFKSHWIYIKVLIWSDSNEQIVNYSKFKIDFIRIDEDNIFVYGQDDVDRLLIPMGSLVQTESSFNEDELLFRLKNKNLYSEIFTKKYLPKITDRLKEISEDRFNLIITEGKTDWKHLKRALLNFQNEGRYLNLDIKLFEYEENVKMGNDALKKIRDYQALFENNKPKIFIFDRDVKSFNDEFDNKDYLYHGNNIYSLLLPVPEHRNNTPLISIEHYYSDEDIQIKDRNNRRLYFASEFDKSTKKHNSINNLYALKIGQDSDSIHILDEKVILCEHEIQDVSKIYNNGVNIALSKNAFAKNILEKENRFESVSTEAFSIIFNLISHILEDSLNRKAFPDSKTEISKGAYLDASNPDFEVLSIHLMQSNKVLKDFKESKTLLLSTSLSDDEHNLIMLIQTNNQEFIIPIQIGNELLRFIEKKRLNIFNRIELFLYDETNNLFTAREIFADEIAATLLYRTTANHISKLRFS
ncbi:hypothetical protein SAMN04487786_0204 [Paenisporosarcina quisquiliarum]|nr:hypothetical protein SAMN04487786_0204 [Paenisporosarcina quisquiliarum]